tara:strand:- start:561 stop:1325 length:765 start_codon:yes stop_codon:yes gene_type:complete
MLLKIKKHKPNELSILILSNGFSFCTQQKSVFLPKNNSNVFDVDIVSKFLDEQNLVFDIVHVIQISTASTIVPEEMFDNQNAAFYLSKGINLKNNEQVVFDVLKPYNQVIVYPEPSNTMEVLKKLFPNLKSKHATSILLGPLNQFSMGTPKKKLFVHLRDGAFDLFLFQSSQLLFFNSFKQNNIDEFLYYLFYITEQFYLNTENFKLAFLGEYECYKEYYEGVQNYHNDIIFLDVPSENSHSKHPVPFLENKVA